MSAAAEQALARLREKVRWVLREERSSVMRGRGERLFLSGVDIGIGLALVDRDLAVEVGAAFLKLRNGVIASSKTVEEGEREREEAARNVLYGKGAEHG